MPALTRHAGGRESQRVAGSEIRQRPGETIRDVIVGEHNVEPAARETGQVGQRPIVRPPDRRVGEYVARRADDERVDARVR